MQYKSLRIAGLSLIAGAVGVMVPFTLLSIHFGYPAILRADPGTLLTRFHAGGASPILLWLAFALLGLPLIVGYTLIGQQLEQRIGYARWVTNIGVASGFAQVIGLLRWVFVVPVIAQHYVQATDSAGRDAATLSFQVVHQFGGVLLGEHLGQLFTIVWTVLMALALRQVRLIPTWHFWWGVVASVIYLGAQGELFSTVIPGFPQWSAAGFVGSTLWLLWLVATGLRLAMLPKNEMPQMPV
jgi:hypothetical protein